MIDAFRSGSWLTRERLYTYPVLIGAALALAFLVLAASGHDGKDRWDRPIGVDFSGIWVAGEAVRAGHPAQPYDNAAHAVAQAKVFGSSDSFLPWPYPPYFLAVAGLLAALPYLGALATWLGVTGLLYLAAVLRAVRGSGLRRRDVLVAALAFPAVAVNVFHGQNGFLSAGLLAMGGFLLPSRPLLAGVALGLLAYKPHFALAVPVVIIAGSYWRAFIAAAATVAAMTLATWCAFGAVPWGAFAASLSFTRHVILEQGGLESWKLQSAFAAVRLLGGSLPLAYALQAVVAALALVGLFRLWRGSADLRLKVPAFCIASLLVSPYAVDYDFVILGPAIAALAALGCERGFLTWEKSALATAWLVPLAARPVAMVAHVPLGLMGVLALFALVIRRGLPRAGPTSVVRPVMAATKPS